VPATRPTVVSDLRRVLDSLNGTTEEALKYSRTCPASLSGPYAWDIETDWDPKVPGSGNTITQWALSTGTETYVLPPSSLTMLPVPGGITHNGWRFDCPKAGLIPYGDDTMVLAYLDDETQPLGLEPLAVKYLGARGWKEGISAPLGSEEFALYNARDAHYTLRVWRVLCDNLGDRKRIADRIIFPAFLALNACSERGIYISEPAVRDARLYFDAQAELFSSRIRAESTVRNPNSSREIAAALLKEGHDLPRTDTGLWSTDSSVLAGLRETTLVGAIKGHRKAAKAINSFVVPYERALESVDRRVHPEYTLWRTLTGRSSARNPNVQQLAREPRLRSFFSAPPGYELLTADYGQIEFRIAAWVAGESTILDRYAANPNWDPHQWFGDIIGCDRQIAKSANFGLLYMAQPFTLQEYVLRTTGIRLSRSEAVAIHTQWHKTFPAFRGWYERTAATLRAQGWVESAMGRRRHFGDYNSLWGKHREAALREAVNFQVQSLAADVAFLGLSRCHQAGMPINGFFHDAISFEFGKNVGGHVYREIEDCMVGDAVRSLEKMGVKLTVPLTVDFKLVTPC
jgi:DNA polymerase-1